jgi:hypothetical protein
MRNPSPLSATASLASVCILAAVTIGCSSKTEEASQTETGGSTATSNSDGSGGATASGGASHSSGGTSHSSGGAAGDSSGSDDPCDDPGLVWKTANKTNYTSYPDPGSEECIEYNGCTWAGQFAACDGVLPEEWVSEHNIVAAFPDFDALELHDLCLRKGDKTLVVTVLDTCDDSDCDGCCTENQRDADQLIDVESYTDARWDVPDGAIEWADLGPTESGGCD